MNKPQIFFCFKTKCSNFAESSSALRYHAHSQIFSEIYTLPFLIGLIYSTNEHRMKRKFFFFFLSLLDSLYNSPFCQRDWIKIKMLKTFLSLTLAIIWGQKEIESETHTGTQMMMMRYFRTIYFVSFLFIYLFCVFFFLLIIIHSRFYDCMCARLWLWCSHIEHKHKINFFFQRIENHIEYTFSLYAYTYYILWDNM